MNTVIVESPAKAKTINKYLGKDYKVIASYGHIRNLVPKSGSVKPEQDFEMVWEIIAKAKKNLAQITASVKESDNIILATDPDREGEAISWHILNYLKEKNLLKDKKIKRVTFNAITENTIKEAFKKPRDLDDNLVQAYLSRVALDYLVGYSISPILWRKLPGTKSAGRVQSVALRLICDRETEIEKFNPEEYWDIEGEFIDSQKNTLKGKLIEYKNEKLEKLSITNEKQATSIVADVEKKDFIIEDIKTKTLQRKPYSPFITSTMQQEASRKLGFSARQTMQTAQRLYEGIAIDGETTGLITYMRTDGTDISQEALTELRNFIKNNYGDEYLPNSPIIYKNKNKNAQEAHEAIRPTNVAFTPNKVKKYLESNEFRLYEIIWERTVACQMTNAKFEQLSFNIKSSNAVFYSSASKIVFDGYKKVYKTMDKEDEETSNIFIGNIKENDNAKVVKIDPNQHFTQAPPRYSEASLIKKLEELGIGRPSTYASIISVLQDREYVYLDKKRFIPHERGRMLVIFLQSFFAQYLEYNFTANMENDLDKVSNGDANWLTILRQFWQTFSQKVESTSKTSVADTLQIINDNFAKEIIGEDRECPSCKSGTLQIMTSRNGGFIGCSNYPDCKMAKPLFSTLDENDAQQENNILGKHSTWGNDIEVKQGPYGTYLETKDKDEKVVRATVPKGISVQELTLNQAMFLLSLPGKIGVDPESGEEIFFGIGKFGPYFRKGKEFVSYKGASIFDANVEQAVEDFKKAEFKKKAHKIGKYEGKEIELKFGRFGAYLAYGGENFKIVKPYDPYNLSLENATSIISKKLSKNAKKK